MNLCTSTWLRKLAYVVPISLRYPRSEGTTNFRRPRESGDLELAPGWTRGGRMSEKRPCVYILASKRNGTLMSVSQVILRAVLGNIVRMLSVDLFEITECTG